MSQNVIQCNCNWTGPQPTAHVASAEFPKLATSMRAKESYLIHVVVVSQGSPSKAVLWFLRCNKFSCC